MKKEISISIIVPVYNVEKYLNKCVESILNQTFKNFELILVDDGSLDNSGKICDEYALKDRRVKVIHKENGGQSSARNVGLDIAQGEYIGFVDSDDWIEPDMYEILYQSIKEYGKDIVNIGFYKVNEKDKIKYLEFNVEKNYNFNREETLIELLKHKLFGNYFWANLYNKKLFTTLRFKEKIKFEDIDLMYKIIDVSNGMIVINQKKYNYLQRESSTCGSYSYKDEIDLQIVHNFREQFLKKKYFKICNKYYNCIWNKMIFYFSYDALLLHLRHNKKNENITKLREILNQHFLQNLKLNLPTHEKIGLLVLKISLSLFVLCIKLNNKLKKFKI